MDNLSSQRTANAIGFIVLILVTTLAVRSILKLSNKNQRFSELEKDYKWRRLKVFYLALSAFALLIVIAVSYGTDEIAPLQTDYDFKLERAEAGLATVINLLIGVAISWSIYRFALPSIYKKCLDLKTYIQKR